MLRQMQGCVSLSRGVAWGWRGMRDEMSDESEQDQQDAKPSAREGADPGAKGQRKVPPLMMVFATGMVVLHTQKYRRNLLFGLTLAMLVMVLVGSVLIGEALMRRPIVFAIYWTLCFLLLFAVLGLALYDLMRVRIEHQAEMRRLDARMSAEMEKLRAEARAEVESESDGEVDTDVEDFRKMQRDHEKAMGDEEDDKT
jgi:hypothetical protein